MDNAKQGTGVRVGVMSFSDGRERVHEGLRPGIEKHQAGICAAIDELGATAVPAQEVAWTPRRAVREAKRLLSQDVACVVFNIPVFAFPNLSALAAAVLPEMPIAIMSPGEANLPGMGGLLAAGGALHQMGRFEERIWGPYGSDDVRAHLDAFIRGTGARHALKGQVYGQIGGRSIGMITGVSSGPAEWLRIFGVDIDHSDEAEILRRAELVPDAERERILNWLEENLRSVKWVEEGKLTRENLKFQAACAAAVKQLAAEREFDFIGIKCHYDMSEYQCTQCLSAAFLPSLVDWDGPREPMVCACEADGDGALSMQVLKLVSGMPPLFLDLRHFDTESGLWTLCNCGGQSNFYACRSCDGLENLSRVDLVPVIPKYGGVGAHVRYVGCAGELTFARFVHDECRPSLVAFRGRSVDAPEEWLERSCPAWPHLFAELDPEPRALLADLHANHVHAAAGDWMDALAMFARSVGIPFVPL